MSLVKGDEYGESCRGGPQSLRFEETTDFLLNYE
tara:strand:+ start:363 stop:464 length:102 start_codon:yes stop_codon:yes gene_type:complete